MPDRVAMLLDGGFVTKKLQGRLGRFPAVRDVVELTRALVAKDSVREMDLLRVYFYDAEPYGGVSTNPIDGAVTRFVDTLRAREYRDLLAGLELEHHFAVRRGSIVMSGWKLGSKASENLRTRAAARTALEARDIVPDLKQKGVDLKIGLDIAWIALRRLADCIVLVTADSDFVPAMKFARREGLKVYLDALGHAHVNRELRVHADLVL